MASSSLPALNIIFLVFLLVASLLGNYAQERPQVEDEVCYNGPDGAQGRCVALNLCPRLLSLLVPSGNVPRSTVLEVLQATQCGYVGTKTKNCCPYDENQTSKPANAPIGNTNTAGSFVPPVSGVTSPRPFLTTTEAYKFEAVNPNNKPAVWISAPINPGVTQQHNVNPFAMWFTTQRSRPSATTPMPQRNHNKRGFASSTGQTGAQWRPAQQSTGTQWRPAQTAKVQSPMSLLPLETCGTKIPDRIIRGKMTSPGSHPWMARIGYITATKPNSIMYSCGGSLITARYVLTAAHCTVNAPSNYRLSWVLLGEHDTATNPDCEVRPGFPPVCSPPPQLIRVERFVSHPQFHQQSYDNDIAIIRLTHNADLSTEAVQPICLPVGDLQSKLYTRQMLTTTGWGITEKGTSSSKLLSASLRVVEKTSCAPQSLTWCRTLRAPFSPASSPMVPQSVERSEHPLYTRVLDIFYPGYSATSHFDL
ncbi:hypothetical protein B566_EDAN011045 [Ephemera danica]|nr:hypothetical protein B566_EDAN011045 [Ephemera danica]